MATLDALDAVRDVAAATIGITSAYRLMPEKAIPDNRLPAAVISLDRERLGFVELSGLERWEWPVQVDILAERVGDNQSEQASVVPLLEAFIAESRGHMNLSGTGAFHADLTWQLRTLAHLDAIYHGVRIQVTVEQHFEVAAQYGN